MILSQLDTDGFSVANLLSPTSFSCMVRGSPFLVNLFGLMFVRQYLVGSYWVFW